MLLRRLPIAQNVHRFFSCLSLSSVLFASVAGATNFGPLQGNSEMGRPLKLHAELSNLNDDARGQLRSTCMTASFIPGGDVSGMDNRTQTLFVDFVSDGKLGGKIFLKSRDLITDPVGTVRLRSECPLSVFEVTWSVLLDPSSKEPLPASRGKSLQADSDLRDFSFDSSASLERSLRLSSNNSMQKSKKQVNRDDQQNLAMAPTSSTRVPADTVKSKPKERVEREPEVSKPVRLATRTEPSYADNPPQYVEQKKEVDEPSAAAPDAGGVKPAVAENAQPDELALLDQKLADVNLIPSASSHGLPGAASNRSPLESASGKAAIQVSDIPLLIGVGSLLLLISISGFWFYRQRQVQSAGVSHGPRMSPVVSRAAHSRPVGPDEIDDPVVYGGGGEASVPGEVERHDAKSRLHAEPGQLMLHSFLGADHVAETADSSRPFELRSSTRHAAQGPHDSLSSVLSMVNRAEAKLWKLPELYNTLIADRNKSLALSASGQSQLLRTQIGLVELAYQEAKHDRILDQDLMSEFVSEMLKGLDLNEIEQDHESVPDVIQSYLSAKFCEVSGPQEKSCFKANCMALSLIAEQWPVCFDSEVWEALVTDTSVGS